MMKAFVSGHYYKGSYVAHDAEGKVVPMRPIVREEVKQEAEQRKEIRLEPWIRKALDSQRKPAPRRKAK